MGEGVARQWSESVLSFEKEGGLAECASESASVKPQ